MVWMTEALILTALAEELQSTIGSWGVDAQGAGDSMREQ